MLLSPAQGRQGDAEIKEEEKEDDSFKEDKEEGSFGDVVAVERWWRNIAVSSFQPCCAGCQKGRYGVKIDCEELKQRHFAQDKGM